MINYFVHLGFPLPQLAQYLHFLFTHDSKYIYLNNSAGDLPNEIASDFGDDFLLTRRHIYPVAPFVSPFMQKLVARSDKNTEILGFSLPNFMLPSPDEVDIATRMHRLYDQLFYGMKILVTLVNQLDFIKYDYSCRTETGHISGSLDDYVQNILRNKYYGPSVDLRYEKLFRTLEDVFGRENILVITTEELLSNPAMAGAQLISALNEQPIYPVHKETKTHLKDYNCLLDKLSMPPREKLEIPALSESSRTILRDMYARSNTSFLAAQNNPSLNKTFELYNYPL